MKKSLSEDLIREIALESGIEPAFVEKDWYAVQLIALIAQHGNDQGVQAIFSGGTSLSKGYQLIERFSEDLDFVLSSAPGADLSAGQRRSFRRTLIAHLSADERFTIDDAQVERGDSHRFFKAPVNYQRLFDQALLRPHLQLEMTFSEPRLPPQIRQIHSIAGALLQEEAEAEIACVSPLETAGDKLSALTWRIVVRNRDDMGDDPTMIRHLHDLAALEGEINSQTPAFVETAQQSLEQDQTRRGGHAIREMAIADRLARALEQLRQDALYRTEYEQFVLNMSYAKDENRIDFDGACTALERIIRHC